MMVHSFGGFSWGCMAEHLTGQPERRTKSDLEQK